MSDGGSYDILVVGSGGAGLRAAIRAAESGCKTLILSKGKVNRSGATLLAGANISADVECDGNSLFNMGFAEAGKDDSKDAWFSEIVEQGMFLNNQKLVQTYVDDAPDRVRELIDWGVKVYGLESERGISVSSRELLDVLMKRLVASGAQYQSDVQALELLVTNGRVSGVLGVHVFTGEYVTFSAKAVILATGGWHGLYPFNAGGTDLTGDGQAMAFRAGADMINMEMVTFCPNTLLTPRRYRGSILPYIFTAYGYGHLLNRKGEEFLGKYFKPEMMDLALHTEWNKLLLSFAEFREIEHEGTPGGGVYFSMKHCPNEVFETIQDHIPGLRDAYPDMIARLASGYSLEIAPSAEYFEGGIWINERYETSIPGLYAAGECSGGTFGSNRVSAATTQMLVQGYEAAGFASQYANESDHARVDGSQVRYLEEVLEKPFASSAASGANAAGGSATPTGVKKTVGDLAIRHMSMIRDGEGLKLVAAGVKSAREALNGLTVSNTSRAYNPEWLDFITARNFVDVLGMSAGAAMIRTESRGVHYRDDHPYTDNDNWLKTIVVHKGSDGGAMEFRSEPVVTTRIALPGGRDDYQAYIASLAEKYV